MDETTVLAAVQRYWEYAATDQDIAHEMYHDDAVLEFPQSQERFEGKANFMAWRKIYPAAVESKIRRIRGQGNFWVVEVSIRYDGESELLGRGLSSFNSLTLWKVGGMLVLR
jgi:hypothetical protein